MEVPSSVRRLQAVVAQYERDWRDISPDALVAAVEGADTYKAALDCLRVHYPHLVSPRLQPRDDHFYYITLDHQQVWRVYPYCATQEIVERYPGGTKVVVRVQHYTEGSVITRVVPSWVCSHHLAAVPPTALVGSEVRRMLLAHPERQATVQATLEHLARLNDAEFAHEALESAQIALQCVQNARLPEALVNTAMLILRGYARPVNVEYLADEDLLCDVIHKMEVTLE